MSHLYHLSTPRTGRLVIEGDPDTEVQQLWLVFHGYRQLAPNFIRRFAGLIEPGVVVAAPEGLSRFYVEGVRGKVGASWMTKEDRLREIEDQHAWLDRVWAHLQTLPGEPQVHLLGFSQGVATLWRWLRQRRDLQPDTLTLWAGSIPEEFDADMDRRLSRLRLTLAYASHDEFISQEQAEAYLQALRQRYPHLEPLPFDGRHEVPAEPLAQLRARLYA